MRQEKQVQHSGYMNCPTNKNIVQHYEEQLIQLSLQPRSKLDKDELMKILNVYLSYADDDLANKHRMANKLGLLDVEAEERIKIAQTADCHDEKKNQMRETKIFKMNTDTCHCCGFFIKPQDIGICQVAPEHVKNLGTSNRIFFQTFCYLTILLVVMTVVYSAFAFGTNISVAKNTPNYLGSSSLDYLSISLSAKSRVTTIGINNDGEKFFFISSWFGVAMLILWAFIFGFIRKEISMIEHKQQRKLGVSDFSVVIENMPTDFTREEIQQQFNQFLKNKKDEDFDKQISLSAINVVKYNEGKPFYLDEKEFADTELVQLLKKHDQIKQKIASYVIEYRKYNRFDSPVSERTFQYSKFQEIHDRKQRKYSEIISNLRKKLASKMQANRTVVFVTFQTHEQRNFVVENNKNTLYYKIKRGLQFWKESDYFKVKKGDIVYNNVVIELPPEPEDINWGNLGMTNCQKFVRFCFTIFVSLIMVGISLLIVYGLSTVQRSNNDQRFISIIISLAISVTNLLIIKVIQFMTVIEKVYSMNNYQISIAFKSVVVQLINSIAVPIVVNYHLKDGNIFGRSGLCEDILVLAVASSFVPPIVRLFDPYNIFLIIRYKFYSDEERRLYLNQYELNQIGEKQEFQIGLEYIYVIHNFIFVCFFVSLQPVIPIFAILAYFLMYWIEKYALFSRCQRPVPGPDVITSKLYQLIFFGAVAFALGNLTWSWFLPDQSFRNALLPNIVSLGLALIIFIFPYEKMMSKDAVRQEKDYYQKRIYFPSEYDRLNPSTSRQAIEEYRTFLEQMKKKVDEGGDPELENSLRKGFQNLSQNNIHKHNIMNRLSNSEQNLVIQQLLYNQSRNVVNPQLLLSIIIPSDHKINQNSAPVQPRAGTNVNIGRSMIYQESSKALINDPYPNIDHNSFQEDFTNVYKTNFRPKGMPGMKKTDSETFSEKKAKRDSK